MNRRVGHGSHAVFGQKLLDTQHRVGRSTCKSPIMKWANMSKESSKNSQKLKEAAPHKNASWYTDTDGFLEHSPSGEDCTIRDPEDNSSFCGGFPLVKPAI